jgi:predicted molibdopterin-dependent oxidoreductase YjgC
MFLTETPRIADVVLPAANLYEKSGTVTNTYGDLQQVKKAADRAGVRTDFEIIVRIADKMGATCASSSPSAAAHPRRHGPDPRRAVRRGRPPRRLAHRQQP